MFDHWFVLIVVIAIAIVAITWWIHRMMDKHADTSSRHIWQCCRYQGGGTIYTPTPMTESEAVHFASSLGSIQYVDREHFFVFYRPTGH